MADIYDTRRYGTIAFIVIALCVVAVFLYVSDRIVSDLARQEHERMEIWADATKTVIGYDAAVAEGDSVAPPDMELVLRIIEGNRTIPVLLADDNDVIILYRNFDLPEPADSLHPLYISQANSDFLHRRLNELKGTSNVIHIIISPGVRQHLYYEDSRLLRLLSYYPYVQILVMLIFVATVYYAVTSTKKAEQNKVWIGLSKETAHQLGTPISSLMAWMELLPSLGVDSDTVGEMDKDVRRLSMIASRFGKIGSRPSMEPVDLNEVVRRAVNYMSTRISDRVALTLHPAASPLEVELSASLFEWVMENLIKNAVDAIDGDGSITITLGCERGNALIDVADTGKGIPRNRFKTVFNPGYTTKRRGWGLGLALARRIVEQYHRGRIAILSSDPRRGTVFRITLPLLSSKD